MKLSTHFTLAQLDRYQTCKPMMVSGGNFVFLRHLDDNSLQQKYIPVGCVPPTLNRTRRVLCPGALCPGGSLPKGVIVQGVSVQGDLSRGVSVRGVSAQGDLCPWGSLSRGSLSRGICPGGLCPGGPYEGDPLRLWKDRNLWNYYLAPNFLCGR